MIVDVWSDVVCPWCFIGRRRLQKALQSVAGSENVTVRHRAFQLQPDASGVMPTKELLAKKYNLNPEQVESSQANVCSIADGEGLCYDLTNTMSGNTGNAHRLLKWAETQGKEDALLEAMYSGYFEKSQGVFSDAELLAFVAQVGLDQSIAKEILASNDYSDEVLHDQHLAQQLGANGVPFFVFDMKYGISGAQPQEVFNATLEKALEESVTA
jgi:predicted DsbA family dithiol-disulfide isomerase